MEGQYIVPEELLDYAKKRGKNRIISIPNHSTVDIPFQVNFPKHVEVGPGRQIHSRVKVQYFAYANIIYQSADKLRSRRECQEINVLPSISPSSFLDSPSIMCVSKQPDLKKDRQRKSATRITVSLPRTDWLAGESVVSKIKIENHSKSSIKTLKLCLYRRIIGFDPPSWKTQQMMSHLNLSRKNSEVSKTCKCLQKETIRCNKKSNCYNWNGIAALETYTTECHIQIPDKEATITVGSNFEVDHFLKISVGNKLWTLNRVEIPFKIISANSLSLEQENVFLNLEKLTNKASPHGLPISMRLGNRLSYDALSAARRIRNTRYFLYS
ncbi:Arrestin [Schizosaccharomyces pombe]